MLYYVSSILCYKHDFVINTRPGMVIGCICQLSNKEEEDDDDDDVRKNIIIYVYIDRLN